MKVTIDTKEDSSEDIKRVFQILGDMLHKKGHSEDLSTTPAENMDTAPLMNMFNDSSQEHSQEQKEIPDKAPDFSSFLNLTKQQKKEEIPRVEFF